MLPIRESLGHIDKYKLKVKKWKKIFHANGSKKEGGGRGGGGEVGEAATVAAGVGILILDKIYFKTRTVVETKKGTI